MGLVRDIIPNVVPAKAGTHPSKPINVITGLVPVIHVLLATVKRLFEKSSDSLSAVPRMRRSAKRCAADPGP